jgi:alkanesulfonate monooxygenase SsuD/methylene tetrahydromethanopterin reductase-like flavin-dependent oxidoreductase (luciferase family)
MTGVHDVRQPSGLGFALRDPYPWDDLAALARTGESLGYRALFLPEVGSRDTLAAITGLASETSTLLMGPGVVPIPSRTPRLLAMAAATAQDRSRGRLVLGVGTGPSGPGALARLRDTVVGVRAALRGEDAVAGGEPLRVGLVPATAVPVWIAALGPKAARLAGEVADGVLLNWCTPERVARAVVEVADGAAVGGRDPAEIAIGVYVRAALADAGEATRQALITVAHEYASYPAYGRQFAAMGLDPADPRAIADAVCLTRDVASANARLQEYRDAGAILPVVYPVIAWDPTDPATGAAHARRTLEHLAPRA